MNAPNGVERMSATTLSFTILHGTSASWCPMAVCDRPDAAVGKISRQRRGQSGKADATFESPEGEPPHLQTRAFALSTLPPRTI